MSSAAARDHALSAAPDARQASMYTKQFPPPPLGALQAPSPRNHPAPATKDRHFTARTTYQAEMLPAHAHEPQPSQGTLGCSVVSSNAQADAGRCSPTLGARASCRLAPLSTTLARKQAGQVNLTCEIYLHAPEAAFLCSADLYSPAKDGHAGCCSLAFWHKSTGSAHGLRSRPGAPQDVLRTMR